MSGSKLGATIDKHSLQSGRRRRVEESEDELELLALLSVTASNHNVLITAHFHLPNLA